MSMHHPKTIALVLSGSLALLPLAACSAAGQTSGGGSSEETSQDAGTTEEGADPTVEAADGDQTAEPILGGWQVVGQVAPIASDEETERFERATAEYDGTELTPVAVVATQLVSGNNYAYLCAEGPVEDGDSTQWAIAVVYEDLEGNASVTSVNDINIADLKTADASTGEAGMMGAWQVVVPDDWAPLPQQAASAFTGALADYVGVGLTPIALLGTQVVSGTNYLALAAGGPVTADPVDNLYAVVVYEDLEGNAEVSSVETLDLLSYVG